MFFVEKFGRMEVFLPERSLQAEEVAALLKERHFQKELLVFGVFRYSKGYTPDGWTVRPVGNPYSGPESEREEDIRILHDLARKEQEEAIGAAKSWLLSLPANQGRELSWFAKLWLLNIPITVNYEIP